MSPRIKWLIDLIKKEPWWFLPVAMLAVWAGMYIEWADNKIRSSRK